MRILLSVLCLVFALPTIVAASDDAKRNVSAPIQLAQATQQPQQFNWSTADQNERNRILRILRDSKLYDGTDLNFTNQSVAPELLRNPLCVAACHAAYAIAVAACGGVPICLAAAEVGRQICIGRC